MALQPHVRRGPLPISYAPSQAFEGNDGSWSTFALRVGTPEQVFHVLISTAGQETWVPVPEGCNTTDPTNCGTLRGVLPFQNQASTGFQVNASSTWRPNNFYPLGLDSNLNYTGDGEYGYDTVGLQLPASGGVSLPNQVVAGIETKDFLLGVFSLGPRPTNFSTFDDPKPSFLGSLRNQSLIPSLSWSYTAGASYKLKGVPGSLTLGGYDTTRFIDNHYGFSMSADDSKPLTVGVQRITATNTFEDTNVLLPSGVLAFIDSTVPELWLPVSACALFETAFGLTFDASTDRYLVNDTVHTNLLAMNPVISFSLGNTISGGDAITINVSYQAFDLQANWPIYPNATNYFPLRRAQNDTQYTLGRVFLQESFVIADFERSIFNVSQALFPPTSTSTEITAIYPPGIMGSSSSQPTSTGLSKDILVAIIVCAIVLILIILTILYILFRLGRKRKREKRESEQILANYNVLDEQRKKELRESGVVEGDDGLGKPDKPAEMEVAPVPGEIEGSPVGGVSVVGCGMREMVGTEMRHELATTERPSELAGREVQHIHR